jgi:hypothetical protein
MNFLAFSKLGQSPLSGKEIGPHTSGESLLANE